MPNSNPGPLPHKSGALPMSHHIYKLMILFVEGVVKNLKTGFAKKKTGSATQVMGLAQHGLFLTGSGLFDTLKPDPDLHCT